MTIKVYRATATGQRQTVRPLVTVPTGDPERLPESLEFPPCACRRCLPTARARPH